MSTATAPVQARVTGRLRGHPGMWEHYALQRIAFWTCVDCHMKFPYSKCNGVAITLCPWCRPDSKPWTAGRGS